jgi:4-diphosphocytidyl-2-C-methyl-D-erythritol kinase
MSSQPLSVRAPAKVNLFLNVTGRRADGYHELDSLFAFCGLADTVTIATAEDLRFDAPVGPYAHAVEHDGTNLVMRAAALLRQAAGVAAGARIGLTKVIPVAAGLGGGSADAAAVLSGLNRFWGLHWPDARLEALAERLGADVPACVRSAPVHARGIGERLSPAPALPPCGVLLANPRIPTPTPAVFKIFSTANPVIAPLVRPASPDAYGDLASLVADVASRGNDLLPAAIAVTPAIGEVLAALRATPGVAHAGLSGSGATCFALLETPALAGEAARGLAARHPGWWIWSGGWI